MSVVIVIRAKVWPGMPSNSDHAMQVIAAMGAVLLWKQGPEYVLVIDGGSSGTRV